MFERISEKVSSGKTHYYKQFLYMKPRSQSIYSNKNIGCFTDIWVLICILTLRIMAMFKKEIATDPFTLYEVRWYYENCTVCLSVRKYVMWTTCEITEFLIQRMVKMAIYNCYFFTSRWIQGKPVERFIKKILKTRGHPICLT